MTKPKDPDIHVHFYDYYHRPLHRSSQPSILDSLYEEGEPYCLALLQTCRQVHHEALKLRYVLQCSARYVSPYAVVVYIAYAEAGRLAVGGVTGREIDVRWRT